jgi:hypothetical protein
VSRESSRSRRTKGQRKSDLGVTSCRACCEKGCHDRGAFSRTCELFRSSPQPVAGRSHITSRLSADSRRWPHVVRGSALARTDSSPCILLETDSSGRRGRKEQNGCVVAQTLTLRFFESRRSAPYARSMSIASRRAPTQCDLKGRHASKAFTGCAQRRDAPARGRHPYIARRPRERCPPNDRPGESVSLALRCGDWPWRESPSQTAKSSRGSGPLPAGAAWSRHGIASRLSNGVGSR